MLDAPSANRADLLQSIPNGRRPAVDVAVWRPVFQALIVAFEAVGTEAALHEAQEMVAAAIVAAHGAASLADALLNSERLLEESAGIIEDADSERLAEVWGFLSLLSGRQLGWLEANGVGFEAIERAGGLRSATLDACDAGWSYEGPSQRAVAQQVLTFLDGEPALSAVALDLVAWHPARPDAWWLYRGNVDWLGGWDVTDCCQSGQPLALHASPLEWLRAGCEGAVLLTPCAGMPMGGRENEDRYLRHLVAGISELVVPPGWGERVFEALRRRPAERASLPEVWEREAPR